MMPLGKFYFVWFQRGRSENTFDRRNRSIHRGMQMTATVLAERDIDRTRIIS